MKNKKDLKVLSEALDSKFQIGGFRFGYDGLIGLVPVIGDTITMTLSMYIVVRAILMGYPTSIIIRMILNILTENVIGVIPVLGNFFDFVWKSNLKNIKLLETYDANPQRTLRSTKFQILMILLLVFGTFIISLYLIIKLAIYLLSLLP